VNNVAGPGIIGKDNYFLTTRTTDLLQRNGNEMLPLFPQPEGKAGSKRTVDDVPRPGVLG